MSHLPFASSSPAGRWLGGLTVLRSPSLQRAEPSTRPWLGSHLGLSVLSQGVGGLQSREMPRGGCPGAVGAGVGCGLRRSFLGWVWELLAELVVRRGRKDQAAKSTGAAMGSW